jgi:hypothetical protein
MDWKTLESIDIEIDRAETERIAGVRATGEGAAGGRARERIDSALRTAARLIEPAAIYTVIPGELIEGPPVFSRLEEMALCICTIGGKLERKSAELSAEGRILEGLVIDTAGSVAVEQTADYVSGLIEERAGEDGKRTSRRASPGYGNWDISAQRSIFRIAPAERIGVTLNEGMMMEPAKSVTFAIHIAENPVRLRSANDCRSCDRKDCRYRRN